MRRFIYDEPVTRWAVWSRRIAVFALIVAGYAVVLIRGGAQDLRGAATAGAALVLILAAMMAALIAFVRIWREGLKGTAMAAQTMALVILLLAMPSYYVARGLTLPPLTDVTTDIENPPAFSRSRAALAARNGRIPPDVSPALRDKQRNAYPAVAPILLDMPAEDAFALAVKTAKSLGWEVIEQAPPSERTGVGRIEAIQRTTLMRFTDDITIRVRPRAGGARIDVRSASRIGNHDLGANARRITRFIDDINEQANTR